MSISNFAPVWLTPFFSKLAPSTPRFGPRKGGVEWASFPTVTRQKNCWSLPLTQDDSDDDEPTSAVNGDISELRQSSWKPTIDLESLGNRDAKLMRALQQVDKARARSASSPSVSSSTTIPSSHLSSNSGASKSSSLESSSGRSAKVDDVIEKIKNLRLSKSSSEKVLNDNGSQVSGPKSVSAKEQPTKRALLPDFVSSPSLTWPSECFSFCSFDFVDVEVGFW